MSQGALARTSTAAIGTAFIAMPFNSHFDGVLTAIQNAVLRARFTPERADRNIAEKDWLEAVYRRTKSAAIVIAVCTPEPQTKAPNPNVMYELGFADCLGTPTIIVAADVKSLPSDLATQNAVAYSKSDLKKFEHELCSVIQARTSRQNGRPMRSAIGSSSLTGQALQILEFVKRVHHCFQTLDTPLDDFQRVIEEGLHMTLPEELCRHEEPSRRVWEQYEHQYGWLSQDLTKPWAGSSEPLDVALSALENDGAVGTLRQNYEALKTQALQVYPLLHNQICQMPRSNLRLFTDTFHERRKLWGQLKELSRMAKQITSVADNLIFNLIGLLTGYGGGHV